ncbi:MAG TPA: roadblock/LC7 domain-containing protein [Drouetiella sp.]
MYKLNFNGIAALICIVLIMGSLFGSMYQLPNLLFSVPGWLTLVAVFTPALLAAFIVFRKGSIAQRIKMAALGMALGFLYGFAANVHFGTTRILPDYAVLINECLFGFMALGGAITACAMFQLRAVEGYVDTKKPAPETVVPEKEIKPAAVEESPAKISSTKIPAQTEPLRPAASASATNLKGLLDTLAPEEEEAAAVPEKPAKSGLAASLGAKSSAPKIAVEQPAKEPIPAPAPTPAAVTPAPTQAPTPVAESPAPVTPTATPVAEVPSQSPNTSTTSAPALAANQTNSTTSAPVQRATTGTSASSTATRLQAQKRKSTSTFTKLQALSASGTGGVREKPRETTGGDDSDSLKSILDRLDTKQDEEVEMDSLFGQESLLSPPELSESDLLTAKPEPEVVKEPEIAKTVEVNKPEVKAESKPAATPAKPATPTAPAKPSTSKTFDSNPGAKKAGDAPSLSSMLDSLDTPKKEQSSSPAAKTSSPNIPLSKQPTPPFTQKPSSVVPPKEGIAPKAVSTPAPKPVTPAPAKATTPVSTPKPVETPKPAAKVEPAKTVEAPTPSVKSEPAKVESKPAAKIEEPKMEAAKSESNLFETGLDKEIDDIFSNLVPADAQKGFESRPGKDEDELPVKESAKAEAPKEQTKADAAKVADEPINAEETTKPTIAEAPPVVTEAAPEKEGLFETQIDQELDDIFSNLVPAEAQKEVAPKTVSAETKSEAKSETPAEAKKPEPAVEAKSEPKPIAESKPEPVAEPVAETSKEPQGMFADTGLDAELDDIFSNLAPSEAQQQVTPSTLARVRAADVTGDHPALTPDNLMRAKAQEEMSFAPPTEDEKVEEESPGQQAEEASKPIKFNETLQAMPSLQATVEGLLSNLASSESKKVDTESFAPPESTGSNGGGGTSAQDLIASLESGQSQAAQESVEAAESSSGDIVDDLFQDSTRETAKDEPNDELVTEAVSESSPEPVAEESSDTKEAEATETEATEVEAEPAAESEVSKKTAKQLKEFGRLSSKPASGDFQTETAGTMKTVGKLLLEVQAVENIIKAGESGTIGSGLTTARVISAARGEGIKALLSKIDSYAGVDGSVIVGHDGLVIASTAPQGMDKDTLGVLSVACLSTSNLATKKLEIGKLRQMVLLTDEKTTVLTDVDVGILAVFMNNNDITKIDGLLEAIHDTIHG